MDTMLSWRLRKGSRQTFLFLSLSLSLDRMHCMSLDEFTWESFCTRLRGSGQEAQPCTERLNAVSHNDEKLKLDLLNRDGLSDLGAQSKFQVWVPNTIIMCSFTLTLILLTRSHCLFIPSQPVVNPILF